MKWTRVAVVAGSLALLVGVGWKIHRRKNAGPSEVVRSVTVKRGSIETTVEATGEVSPLNRVEIKPPIQGRIEKLWVDEGSRVRDGDVIALMSSSDRVAILDAARSQGLEALKRWEDSYRPTPILAPLSGTIILRNVVVGQTVDLSTVLFALSDRLIVLAQVDETDIGRIVKDLPCRILLDAYPTTPLPGRVFDILHEGKNVSNVITYDVKIQPESVPPFFRSQMTANVSFILARKEDTLLVPAAALRDGTVSVPGLQGRPVSRDVSSGITDGDNVEILSGLKEGDTVLLSQKRYEPQQAASSSPLVMGGGGRSRSGGTGGNGGRRP